MLKKLCASLFISLIAISSFLSAGIEYDIQDIGTLQTHSSQAIALNNQGQILGWYNIDGSKEGKRFFVRDRDGSFHEIAEDFSLVYLNVPQELYSVRIDWKYLTDDGRAYGTFNWPNDNPVLFMWDQHNGLVKLGRLPGKEISAINNAGQVLIKSVVGNNQYGKQVKNPVIWENGKITKLHGLEGDLGIESDESYGFDMNNNGEVVGQSVVYLSYKNDIYKQVHATKWVNSQAIDLHKMIPKSSNSSARSINDLGEVFIDRYLICNDGNTILFFQNNLKTTNTNYLYDIDKHGHSGVYDKNRNTIIDNSAIANKVLYDTDSIWMSVIGIVSANDSGEVIAQATTIYGEQHAMFLSPVKSN